MQTIPPMANSVSVGRVTTRFGTHFVPLARRTFGNDSPESVVAFREGGGAPNAKPQVGPVVISEIMYEGQPNVDGLGSAQLEYVELHNLSEQAVPLFNPVEPQNTWRIRGGVKLDFPAHTTLPPGGYQLIVGFDPAAEPVGLAGFGLSDDSGDPFKWSFPKVAIAPGEHLLVFASGKDRRVLRKSAATPLPAISGLRLWLDASDSDSLTVDAVGRVSRWQSANGITAAHPMSASFRHVMGSSLE